MIYYKQTVAQPFAESFAKGGVGLSLPLRMSLSGPESRLLLFPM